MITQKRIWIEIKLTYIFIDHNIIFCVNGVQKYRIKHLNIFNNVYVVLQIELLLFVDIYTFDILNSHDHAKIYIKINYICIEIKLTYIFIDHSTGVKRTILYLYAEAISVNLVYNNRDEKLLSHIPMEG